MNYALLVKLLYSDYFSTILQSPSVPSDCIDLSVSIRTSLLSILSLSFPIYFYNGSVCFSAKELLDMEVCNAS